MIDTLFNNLLSYALKINIIILLLSLTVFNGYILINIIKKFRTCYISCNINTDVSISLDGGTNYTNKIHSIIRRSIVHIRFDITVKTYGFLSYLRGCIIPFEIEIPTLRWMDNSSVYECSGIEGYTRQKTSENIVTYSSSIIVDRKKAERAYVIIKFEKPLSGNDYEYTFNLIFKKPHIRKYSRTIVLDFVS